MSALGVLRKMNDGRLAFHCPGCKSGHWVRPRPTETSPSWEWNGSFDKPTFSPSILVTCRDPDGEIPDEICHSFVVDGRIQFLNDCTHDLAGATVDLRPYDEM